MTGAAPRRLWSRSRRPALALGGICRKETPTVHASYNSRLIALPIAVTLLVSSIVFRPARREQSLKRDRAAAVCAAARQDYLPQHLRKLTKREPGQRSRRQEPYAVRMLQIIGSVVVLGCVVGGFLIGGGHLLLLWHPTEVLIICGSAFGAFLISNPLKVVKGAFAGAISLPKGPRYKRDDYRMLLKLLHDVLQKIRKEGLPRRLPTTADLDPSANGGLGTLYGPNVTASGSVTTSEGLIPAVTHRILDTVAQLRASGVAILLVEQQVKSALRICDRIALIENGAIQHEAPASELAADPVPLERYIGVHR